MRIVSSSVGSRAILLLTGALLGACGAGDGTGESAEATGGVDQPVYGGTETTRIGVVEIYLGDHSCSGVMISPQVILTAGHCGGYVLPAGTKTALIEGIRVVYKVGAGRYRDVAGGDLRVTQWPGYTSGTDAANDLAVLTTSDRWDGTTSTDYAYIYTDTMGAYSRYQLYGYGANTFGGGGVGFLRTGTMEVDWFGSQHFILIDRGSRLCKGDSGGPATVYESVTGSEMHVAGLASNLVATPGGYCDSEGANARYTRLSGKVDWIKQTTGANCVQMHSQKTNRLVTRCFDYSILKRTVRDCKTRNALGPEQTIDLSTGYSNYRCGDRYQEQCVADGTPDMYYVESCQ